MARHSVTFSKRVSDQFRRLDRLLHIDRRGQTEWVWAIPILGFFMWVATLLAIGLRTGVWAAEFIPTALLEGLVIAGLFVACTVPDGVPSDDDQGNRGPGNEPLPMPPRSDPAIWLALLADLDADATPADRAEDESQRRPSWSGAAEKRT
jgi:hypothetical protein